MRRGAMVVCRACGLPRVAEGWPLPPEHARAIRDAVTSAARRKRRRWLAVGLSVVVFWSGPIVAGYLGVFGWVFAFFLWAGIASWIGRTRRAGRKLVPAAVAAAEAARCQDLARTAAPALAPHVRVDTVEAFALSCEERCEAAEGPESAPAALLA